MGKKAKGGGGGGEKASKEPLPTEAEATLLLKIAALEEKLAKIQGEADKAMSTHQASSGELAKEKKDNKEIFDYLKMQLQQKKDECAALEAKYADLVQAKEESEKRLEQQIGDLKEELKQTQNKLTESETQVSRLSDQVVEIGNLRAGKESDAGTKSALQDELAKVKLLLHESNLNLTVLAVADDRIVGEDGARALPLMLLEAIRLHLGKPVLVEQAMVALQYVLSEAHGHIDSELIRTRGGIEILLDAMTRHADVAELQSSACGLLWKLAFADPATREVVIKADGMALIMGGMQQHTNHPRLQYNACGALRQMLVTAPRDFSKESQIDAGRKPEVLPPINDPRAGRRRGLPHDPRTLPMRIGQTPVRGSRSNPHLATVAPPGAGTMRSSAAGLSTRPATTANLINGRVRHEEADSRLATKEEVSVQALRLTLQSMAAHADTPLVQEYGCGTLYNVVLANPAMRHRLTQEDGVATLLSAMRAHTMVTGVQINACALLKELAEHQPALQLIEDGGGRQLLLTALEHHQYNDDLLTRATEALRYLPEPVPLEQ